MKRFNNGDVIYSRLSNQVLVVERQVIIDKKLIGCIAMYVNDEPFNPENRGLIFSAFISYDNYEMNYYEILEENNV